MSWRVKGIQMTGKCHEETSLWARTVSVIHQKMESQ